MQNLTLIQTIAVWIVPILLAITLHEAAHALVANWCGDNTAKKLRRLSMNPLRHIDLVGTVLVPIVVALISQFQFVFGWAKPVPINWYQLRNPRRDMALVAAAGPVSNIIMALIWASCMKAGLLLNPGTSLFAMYMVLTGQAGIFINLVFALLNLIPVPPLDGSRVLASIFPPKMASYYMMLESFGFLIVFLLLFTGVLGWMLDGPLSWSVNFIYSLFNIRYG